MSKTTTTLVFGATGATGRHVVRQLLQNGHMVRAIVRSKEKLLQLLTDIDQEKLLVVEGNALDLANDEFEACVKDCDSIVSCLGHNLTFSGVYGHPRKLVTDTAKKCCETVNKLESGKPTKFILMGSNGVANPDGTDDVRSLSDRAMLSVIRWLLPPHTDNEDAASYFSNDIGRECFNLEWVVVRPADLLEGEVSRYEVNDKPSGTLFNGGQTTRANVAAFMCDLIVNEDIWNKWKFQMPVPVNVVDL